MWKKTATTEKKNSAHIYQIINGYIAQNAALLIINEFSVGFSHARHKCATSEHNFIIFLSMVLAYTSSIFFLDGDFCQKITKILQTSRAQCKMSLQDEKKNVSELNEQVKKKDILRGKLDIAKECLNVCALVLFFRLYSPFCVRVSKNIFGLHHFYVKLRSWVVVRFVFF